MRHLKVKTKNLPVLIKFMTKYAGKICLPNKEFLCPPNRQIEIPGNHIFIDFVFIMARLIA